MSRSRALAVVLATAAAVGLAGCSGTTSGAAGDSRYVAAKGDSTVTLVPVDKRGEGVDVSGTTLSGEKLDLATMRGKPVVLNVWGSWCPPCRKEAPDLQAASVKLKADGVPVVGIDVRDLDPAPAVAFEKRFGITYPSLYDPKGAQLLALRGAVSANAIPTTLVLDADGRVAARINGATTTTTVVDVVHDVAAGT